MIQRQNPHLPGHRKLADFTLLAPSEREQIMRRLIMALTSAALLGTVVGCHCIMGKCDCDPLCPCGTNPWYCGGGCGCGCGCGAGHWFGDPANGNHLAAVPGDHPNGPYAPAGPVGTPVGQGEPLTVHPSAMTMPAALPHPQSVGTGPQTVLPQPVEGPLTEPILK
jgi:hypothetical protein